MEQYIFTADQLAEFLGQPKETIFELIADKGENGELIAPAADQAAAKLLPILTADRQRFLIEGEKAGKRKQGVELETAIRAKYGLTSTAQGIALIDTLATTYAAKIAEKEAELEAVKSAKKDGMTDEEAKAFIANHPFFASKIAEKEAAAAELANQFNSYKSQIETERTTEKASREVLGFLETFRPIEQTDPVIAKTIKQAFLQSAISSAKFTTDANGNTVVLDANNEPIKDDNYRNLTVEQYVHGIAKKFYQQQQADPTKGTPEGGGANGLFIPDWSKMTREEIFSIVLAEKDPAKREKLSESAAKFLN
jgi:hypothetical protein